MNKVLLIGCGHMGSALLNAWIKLKTYSFTVIDPLKYESLSKKYNKKKIKFISIIPNNDQMKEFDIIIFAVKPQVVKKVIKEYQNFVFKKNAVIGSIIAGKKISFYKKNIKNAHQIVRIMPNMPALIGEGVHCIYTNKSINKKEIKEIDKLFSLSGKTLFFNNESFIDKATAVSGSGPGFIFQLIDIMEKSAINLGFTKNTAKILINETFIGSLNLLNSNNVSAEKMVETVATRGGTTEAGIMKMKINKVDKIFNQVFNAAYTRAKQQGKGK